MKFIHKPICSLLLCAALTAFPIIEAHGQDQQHVITMQDADIRSFIDDVAIVTGKTFLVDQRVNGNVTIASEQSLLMKSSRQSNRTNNESSGQLSMPLMTSWPRASSWISGGTKTVSRCFRSCCTRPGHQAAWLSC